MKLAIGTAQFGLNYGVTNQSGVVAAEEITKILNYAQTNDILTIDTAGAYGNSESKLGASRVDLANFKIITKIPPKTSAQDLETNFFQSLNNLKLKRVHGLLIHNASDLLSDQGAKIWKLLEKLRDQALVDKIGVSVYTGDEIKQVLKRYPIDIIQLPINVFDQRLLQSDILEEVKSKKIEIHARSLFLQGILLEKPNRLSEYFTPYKASLIKWHDFLKSNNLTPLEGALSFVYSLNLIDQGVIGITSLDNLIEIKTVFDKIKSIPTIQYSEFAISDEKFINPSIWKV